ncbi:class A beta-lactamase [Streptomyces sp. NPDC008150]|uniref:class A beta-lactamase n=1 Tax=Streptomyces sp. NPDC008150 TaxID=3364816 RepID=UPI0036EBACE8
MEQRFGARLGVYALDTGTGRSVTYRADQRFPYCSTLKALTAGLVLRSSTDEQLSRVVRYDRSDVLEWAPITSQHVDTGMRVRDLLDAALRYSDNTAANLIMERLGGPAQVRSALRTLGDGTTHVDRTEPTLNTALPGDVRDTSTPRALADDLRHLLLGDWLTPQRRGTLADWMARNTTGDPYIRAGVPSGWTVQDKTGNGRYGTRNDIAVVRPPGHSPVVLAVLSRRSAENSTSDDTLIAEATATTVAALR